ncbi:MAG: aldehyde dehydrogenase family protein, partial [candidate division WOR-3 bacterium]
MFINGRRIKKDVMIDVVNPYNGQVIDQVARADSDDINLVIANAVKAARIMRDLPAGERAKILETAAQKISGNEDLARTIALEVGKTIREARAEVARCSLTLKLSADAARELCGQTVRFDLIAKSSKIGFYQRIPVGIVLAITPFNFPLNLSAHKIGPALAAGNAVIHKPATKTPISGIRLAEILVDAGLPVEAISVITAPGGEIGDSLVRHPSIRKISFTGSLEIGERIASIAGMKKLTMELGSNSAVMIFPDQNLEAVAKKIRVGGYTLAGQVCISIQRVYVQEDIFEKFLQILYEEVKAIRVGDPLREDTEMGPMISPTAAEKIKEWIDEAVQAGGKLLLGGKTEGSFLEPTILFDVPEDCKVIQEEAFAPLVVVNKFNRIEDGIEKV